MTTTTPDETTESTPTTPQTSPRNVVEAIIAVMRDVRAVGKDGTNEKQRYNFRGIDGTVNAIGPAMRKHGLIVTPTLRRFDYGEVEVGRDRTKQAHAQVEVEYTFRHSNDDGVITDLVATVPGESMDSGDKGTAKAMSVAFRICLLQTFAVPTMERDPDEDSFERSPGLEPLSTEDLVNACQHAAKMDDPAAAFQHVRDFYGDRLASARAANRNGEELDGAAYVDYAEQATLNARAERARAEQDQDSQGQTREQAPDARAESAPAAQEPAREPEPERAPEPSPGQYQGAPDETRPGASARVEASDEQKEQAARERSAPQETRQDKMKRLAQEELAYQAEVLGQNLAEFAAPALTAPGDLSSLHLSRAAKFIVAQRPPVIEALRKRGDASIAERYAGIGQGYPLVLDKILEGDDSPAREHANQ